jgi:glycerol-3-phosphate acyltransferase PlsY
MNWPVFDEQLPLLIFGIVVGLMIVWKHRANIRRLIAGEEHSFRKTSQASDD